MQLTYLPHLVLLFEYIGHWCDASNVAQEENEAITFDLPLAGPLIVAASGDPDGSDLWGRGGQ